MSVIMGVLIVVGAWAVILACCQCASRLRTAGVRKRPRIPVPELLAMSNLNGAEMHEAWEEVAELLGGEPQVLRGTDRLAQYGIGPWKLSWSALLETLEMDMGVRDPRVTEWTGDTPVSELVRVVAAARRPDEGGPPAATTS
jgi:hypothetical protein